MQKIHQCAAILPIILHNRPGHSLLFNFVEMNISAVEICVVQMITLPELPMHSRQEFVYWSWNQIFLTHPWECGHIGFTTKHSEVSHSRLPSIPGLKWRHFCHWTSVDACPATTASLELAIPLLHLLNVHHSWASFSAKLGPILCTLSCNALAPYVPCLFSEFPLAVDRVFPTPSTPFSLSLLFL